MEVVSKKENQYTYFKFFFSILRYRMFLAISMNIVIGLLDGLGLTMLFPLLQSVDGTSNSKESLGFLRYIFSAFEKIGLPLTINTILLIFFALFVLKAVAKYFAGVYQVKIQLSFIKQLQFQFLQYFRYITYKGYLQIEAGKIQNTLIAEVMRVSEAMKNYLKWSNSLFLLLTYVFLAYLANPRFALLITIGVSLINLLYRRIYKRLKEASYETSRKGVNLNGYLIELVHHFKYLKSTNYLDRYANRLRIIVNERYHIEHRIGKLSSLVTSIKEPTVVLIVVLVMLIQVNFIGGGIGSIILSLLLFYRGLSHLMALQTDWQSFIRFSGGFRMIEEVTNEMKNNKETSGSIAFKTIRHKIRLENVSLSFGKHKVLRNITLEIPKNNTVALTGVSGSGKTTLINVISGLLKPDEGKISIDNIDFQDYDLESYRSKIGYISQESVVFNDTIYNNVTFWAEPTSENIKRFWEVIEIASLTDFLKGQEDKENTKLGDNGILISGGQRQRISIARELFKNPEILILDEATSALDSETERIIQENIEKLHGQYTMIIIAHRLSTIKHVDEIYLLENGQTVHSGKFDDMLEQSDKFKYLVSLQGL